MTRPRAHSLLLVMAVLLGPALLGSGMGAALSPSVLSALQTPDGIGYLAGAAGLCLLLAALGTSLLLVSRRCPRTLPGRRRGVALGAGLALGGTALAAALPIILSTSESLPLGTPVSLYDVAMLASPGLRAFFVAIGGLAAVSALATASATVACWWLLPLKARSYLVVTADLSLLALTIWLTLRYRLTDLSDGEMAGATLRLAATLLLGARIGARLMPYLLDAIERANFKTLVAARHLRAKKSGFLAAISFLSILAVSVSSCALTTTLSVMGGFRQDLKRKILGNNAHIVVDRAQDRVSDVEDLVRTVRKHPEVRGVAPYLAGEVMISSASNLAGAVLRGIDVERIGEVSELPQNMRVGELDFLLHPEKLARMPSTALSPLARSIGLPTPIRIDDEADIPAQAKSPLSKQLAEAKLAEPAATGSAAEAKSERVLPGIVVGQELARSLRLYLGDEVNIVTPLGALGPTGPIPKSRPFRVAGVFYSGMYEYDMKFAYVTLESAQRFLGAGDTVSGVEITVREPERADRVATALHSALRGRPKLRVRPWQELNKNLFGALALEKLAMFIALGIAILVASFCIIGTLTLMVQEKGREVAVLKAMGSPDRAIVGIFVLEGTLIGVFGAFIGLAFGYAACFAAEHFGIQLNPEVYYIDRLPVHVDMSEFLTVGIAAAVVSLLVTIYPAQLASRLRPVDALRYE